MECVGEAIGDVDVKADAEVGERRSNEHDEGIRLRPE